jgi:hypothetical protein
MCLTWGSQCEGEHFGFSELATATANLSRDLSPKPLMRLLLGSYSSWFRAFLPNDAEPHPRGCSLLNRLGRVSFDRLHEGQPRHRRVGISRYGFCILMALLSDGNRSLVAKSTFLYNFKSCSYFRWAIWSATKPSDAAWRKTSASLP